MWIKVVPIFFNLMIILFFLLHLFFVQINDQLHKICYIMPNQKTKSQNIKHRTKWLFKNWSEKFSSVHLILSEFLFNPFIFCNFSFDAKLYFFNFSIFCLRKERKSLKNNKRERK